MVHIGVTTLGNLELCLAQAVLISHVQIEEDVFSTVHVVSLNPCYLPVPSISSSNLTFSRHNCLLAMYVLCIYYLCT